MESQVAGTVALSTVWLGEVGPRHTLRKPYFLRDKPSNHESALEVEKAVPRKTFSVINLVDCRYT